MEEQGEGIWNGMKANEMKVDWGLGGTNVSNNG